MTDLLQWGAILLLAVAVFINAHTMNSVLKTVGGLLAQLRQLIEAGIR
jgi:hypothetical protein